MEPKSPHEKGLCRVVTFGSALSFALLGAIISSMRDFFHGDAALSFSWRTLAGFVIGFILGWLPWRWIGKKASKSDG
jgi:NhaP-type Na+/H+ or K+/H+ antiporter